MRITVLGCGSSGGVPLIGGNWGACNPDNSRNRRLRVSILIETETTTVLIDASPDMRQQLLACGLKKLDAVIITHAHADHCHGIDDLRSVNWLTQKPVDLYADAATMKDLHHRFDYIFGGAGRKNFYRPAVNAYEVTGAFSIGDLAITPFTQDHGNTTSLGIRIGDFAYSTDVHKLSEENFTALNGIKTWIVDCVREETHPTHSHLAQTLDWIAQVKPERAFLTHMNHTMDYDNLAAKCPPGVWPAYDGLVIEC